MHETPEQWINKRFTIANCRGLATTLARAAFEAGRGEEVEEFTFEDWMTNGEAPSNDRTWT